MTNETMFAAETFFSSKSPGKINHCICKILLANFVCNISCSGQRKKRLNVQQFLTKYLTFFVTQWWRDCSRCNNISRAILNYLIRRTVMIVKTRSLIFFSRLNLSKATSAARKRKMNEKLNNFFEWKSFFELGLATRFAIFSAKSARNNRDKLSTNF